MLCVGSVITGSAIFFLSLDEGSGWSYSQLGIYCMLTPWFFFLANILTFNALYTKVCYVGQLMQLQQRGAFFDTAMLSIFVVLAIIHNSSTAWTVVDPWTWEHTIVQNIPAENFGQSTSNRLWLYLAPLENVLFITELATLFYAWKTSDLPDEFRDVRAIMHATFAQMYSSTVGGPMLVILANDSSTNAIYFSRVVLIWIFATSSVILVVGRKIVKAIQSRRRNRYQRRISSSWT